MLMRFSDKIQHHLASSRQAVIVTPNNRLARYLLKAYSDYPQHQKSVWETPTILAWSAWVQTLWRDLQEQLDVPLLLSSLAAKFLWQSVIDHNAHQNIALLSSERAALSSATAWQKLHAWRDKKDPTPFYRWRGDAHVTHETQRFAQWAAIYHQTLQRDDQIDDALLPDKIAQHSDILYRSYLKKPTYLLAGFDEIQPQALRLLTALKVAGFDIQSCEALIPVTQNTVKTYTAPSPSEEYKAALSFAWSRQEKATSSQIGIIVPDLTQRIDTIHRLTHEILPDPSLCNITLGMPSLKLSPIAQTALDLLTLFYQSLPVSQIVQVLQSPYLIGATQERNTRAAIERNLMRRGLRHATFREVISALESIDNILSAQWRNALPLAVDPSTPINKTIDYRLRHMNQVLEALGFLPEDHSLDSNALQEFSAWQESMEHLLTLDSVATNISSEHALSLLAQQLSETKFQPKNTDATIHVMGLFEANNIPFEALWVCGMNTDFFPNYQTPDPLLPMAWQQDQKMPGTKAGKTHEEKIARKYYQNWYIATPELILSYATRDQKDSFMPIPQIKTLPIYTPPDLLKDRASKSPTFRKETFIDDVAPLIRQENGKVTDTIKQDTQLIERQNDCPFQAFGLSRLALTAIEETQDGVPHALHGTLTHQTLFYLWENLQSQESLLQSIENNTLLGLIERAYHKANAEPQTKDKLAHLPEVVQECEKSRVLYLIDTWCRTMETKRAPFTIKALEFPLPLTLSSLTFALRADRVDEVSQNGVAILDYKTGQLPSTKSWVKSDEPEGTQLLMYAIAWAQMNEKTEMPLAIDALSLARVSVHDRKFSGVQIETLPLDTESKEPLQVLSRQAFNQHQEKWKEALNRLATSFLEGAAQVQPRKKERCQYCAIKTFCRVDHEILDDDHEEENV